MAIKFAVKLEKITSSNYNITALGDISDRVMGLELGADDYVIKPFSPKELEAVLDLSYDVHKQTMFEHKITPIKTYSKLGHCLLIQISARFLKVKTD